MAKFRFMLWESEHAVTIKVFNAPSMKKAVDDAHYFVFEAGYNIADIVCWEVRKLSGACVIDIETTQSTHTNTIK